MLPISAPLFQTQNLRYGHALKEYKLIIIFSNLPQSLLVFCKKQLDTDTIHMINTHAGKSFKNLDIEDSTRFSSGDVMKYKQAADRPDPKKLTTR